MAAATTVFRQFILISVLGGFAIAQSRYPPPCNDDIYCYGEILHTVQLARPFEDRKTYTDLPLKLSRESVKTNFGLMMANSSDHPSVKDIKAFLAENFGRRGEELTTWVPQDWKPDPRFLSQIRDSQLRQFGSELNALWKELGKKISSDVKERPTMYSLVYLPNPAVLPGGRFLELYYWDTYWIIRGLIHCEMLDSVKGMLEDFIQLLNTYGYVPNGNRIYYSRTQPPFLIQMFKDYVDATGDLEFLEKHLPELKKEFNFWMTNRSVTVMQENDAGLFVEYKLFRYNNEVTGPRPESYSREYELAKQLESIEERDAFYINMKSGAESGWDFSSRWFRLNTSANSSLLETKTRDIIPVDLNSILHKNAITLADFHQMLHNPEIAEDYFIAAKEMETAINAVLWDKDFGVWFDYDLVNNILRRQFYPSNIFPLWAGITIINVDRTEPSKKIINYLYNCGSLSWDGGIPTSLAASGQQWDFPNAWPPLQHLFVESLENLESVEAQELAFDIAQKWIANNFLTYNRYNKTMFEKYRADIPGEPGGGGLYDVVVGFGWTNGVVLDFLKKYGARLSAMYNDLFYQF